MEAGRKWSTGTAQYESDIEWQCCMPLPLRMVGDDHRCAWGPGWTTEVFTLGS